MALKYKLKYLLVFFFLLFLYKSIALPQLIIQPPTVTQNVYSGFPTELNFNFTNNGTQQIYNLTFIIGSDIGFFKFPIIQNILSNQTIKSNITVTTDGVFNRNYGVKIEFYYIDNETLLQTTRDVNITSLDFVPAYLSINKGDMVIFKNIDTINHSVILMGDVSSGVIEPMKNWSYTFNINGNFSYYDNIGGLTLTGNVFVQDITTPQLKHDVALDKYLILSLNSQYATGEITVNELINNLIVSYTNEGEGAIQIINNRNISLVNVNFEITDSEYSDWITFESQNFNITQGQSRVVTYSVSPKVSKTNETNRTHIIPYKVKSSNAPEVMRNISVFVPFYDLGTVNLNNTCVQLTDLSVDDTISFCLARPDYGNCQKLILFCLEYPDYGKCKELYRERIVEVPVNYNISGDKIEAMLNSVQLSGDVWQRMENKYTTNFEDIASMKSTYETLKSQYDALLAKQAALEEQTAKEKKQKTISNILKVIGFVLFSILFGFFMLFKFAVRKGFEYKLIRLPPD